MRQQEPKLLSKVARAADRIRVEAVAESVVLVHFECGPIAGVSFG